MAAALFASPARAADVAHVRLGSTIEDLIAGPDGGVWVTIDRGQRLVVGSAAPGGGFVTTALDDFSILGSALGPDGNAWLYTGDGRFVRVDRAGHLTRLGPIPRPGAGAGDTLATGPDGTLWALTPADDQIAHISAQGTATFSPSNVPACRDSDSPILMKMRRAADGAMWMSDTGCERLLRMTATGTTEIAVRDGDPIALAADASGGMWFAQDQGSVGHVDASGTVKRFEFSERSITDVAVAADGSAWFATGKCTLARIAPDGAVSSVPAPIPAGQIEFDPNGGLWLASRVRLVHLAPGETPGACDARPPTVRVTPGRSGGTVALRALRRGLRIAVREPAAVRAFAFYYDERAEGAFDLGPTLTRVIPATRGGTVRYRIPAARLARFERRLAEGRRPQITLFTFVTDAEGNTVLDEHPVRITR